MDDRSVLILYGSETGNAQDVAEEMERMVERLRFDAHVTCLDAAKIVRGCPNVLLMLIWAELS